MLAVHALFVQFSDIGALQGNTQQALRSNSRLASVHNSQVCLLPAVVPKPARRATLSLAM
jgi:hypothetical protein